MRQFIVISLALVVVYILVERSGLYAGLINKVSQTAAKGFGVLTKGST